MNLGKDEREMLLQEFNGVANIITPPLGLFSSLKYTLRTWLCLNLTTLIQLVGYNRHRILQWQNQGRKVIINVGSLGEFGNPQYLNADLLLGINYIPKVILNKLGYDLLLNITSCDYNLLNTADGIFLSHVLEHIPPSLALQALKNCLTYLKLGGSLRVTVPDLENTNLAQLSNPRDSILRTIRVNRKFYDWGHKFMYNNTLLIFLMEEAGFSEVQQVKFREGLLGETDLEKYGCGESIYVTGIKL
ncbi:MAG: hypothetical protein QNJ41_04845 [Xenococcaceae cyanobacterium MO_188.B32]|nr:hypothetical protein [Xenococcaceae cyanobacterium MO_188.B32]